MWATKPGDDAPWSRSRRSQLVDDAAKATSTGAVAKSASNDALNAASAKQGAIASISKSKSSAVPSAPLPAPWHRSAPLPAPPTAPWQKPAALPAPPKTQWPGVTTTPPLVDRGGILGTSAMHTATVAKSLAVPFASPVTIGEYRSRLVAIYSVHNPGNVAKVDYLLSKYKDQENLLYTSVCSKYNIPKSWDGRQPLTPMADDQKGTASPVGTDVAPWETLKAPNSTKAEGEGSQPPWAREVKRKGDEGKDAGASNEVEELEAISEALAALQTLTEDMDDRSVPSKPLKPPAAVPSAKGMAVIDYFLVGSKTDFFSDEETMVEDFFKDELSDLDSEEETQEEPEQPEEDGLPEASTVNEPPPETETADPAGPAASEAPTAEAEAAPRMVRRPPTPPRPRRKLPKPQTEADTAPATDPRRRLVSDDDEVVVVSVDGRDAGAEMDEDERLGEQMRKALGASLESRPDEPPQMALPVVPMMEPVAYEEADVDGEAPEAPPPEAPDAKRLAAAAAAARRLQGLESSDSESDSEYSSISSEEEDEGPPMMALPVPTGPEPTKQNGNAPRKTPAQDEDQEVRQKLLGQIFQQLSDYCGTPKRATVKGMQRFVTMVGFEGSDNEWKEEYLSLCKEWKMEPSKGFNQEAFNKMVDDSSAKGCYCSNPELEIILGKILATPRIPKQPKVRKQPPSPPPPPKKQKVAVEVQFQ